MKLYICLQCLRYHMRNINILYEMPCPYCSADIKNIKGVRLYE